MANEDRRVEQFTMRISDDERTRLEALAKSANMKAAEVVRVAVNAWCETRSAEAVFREKGGAG